MSLKAYLGPMIELPGPLTIQIEWDEDRYCARVLELPVASEGDTREEAVAMVYESLALWLDGVSDEELRRSYEPNRVVLLPVDARRLKAAA